MERHPRSNEKYRNPYRRLTFNIVISILVFLIVFFFTRKITNSLISMISSSIIIAIYVSLKDKLEVTAKIRKMESVFPDFIELVASNLRAGMTIDQSLLLSSRKEFSPLDQYIINLGKDVVTGKEIDKALIGMADKINSDKIRKTINVINSGIRSGGNLAILLEETAVNLRERSFVEKRAASNVLMYVIFIFFAAAVGAPILFSLSTVLIQVLSKIVSGLPSTEVASSIPFALTKITISERFITYFSLTFTVVIGTLASMLLGLVNKGEEKEGLKYIAPLIALSLTVFFIIRLLLVNYFTGLLG